MPHQYPGWNLDLRWIDQVDGGYSRPMYPTGIHYNCYGAKSDMLLIREVAMMLVMDRLTDKPDWHIKVFDDAVAAKWREEALAWPDEDLWNRLNNLDLERWGPGVSRRHYPKMCKEILDEECVDYLILELRHKAEHFKKTGVVPTLDATFSVAKSDVLVPPELHNALRDAFARLKADQASRPDWHPNTNDMVQDLVHPSMYPLVYGRSRFFEEEVVGVQDAVEKWAGKGQVIPRRPEWGEEPRERPAGRQLGVDVSIGSSEIHRSYWSTVYQWLPANIKFNPEGGVQFTSYINNLHPNKYGDIYKTIEKLIDTALPLWDQCLVVYRKDCGGPADHDVAGRHGPRIIPEDPDDENEENWEPGSVEEMLAAEAAKEKSEQSSANSGASDDGESGGDDEGDGGKHDSWANYERWVEMREPVQEAPPSFKKSKVKSYAPSRTLRQRYEDTGLQVIVKLASIELTPEKPVFAPGGWHVEGQMNEHIVGTALYYLDSENITDSHLDFRTLTSSYQDDWEISQGGYGWMERVYGAKLGGTGSPCLQNYGSVLTPQGRLLAFPNVFHHRVSGFELKDKTKPGHRRFIAIWLVDPLTRIISTANVPPQQAEWWEDRVFGADKEGLESMVSPELAQLLLEQGLGKGRLDEALSKGQLGRAKLPPEVMEMVRKEFGDDLPMTREEAEEHRRRLMATRSAFQVETRGHWRGVEYSFCEH